MSSVFSESKLNKNKPVTRVLQNSCLIVKKVRCFEVYWYLIVFFKIMTYAADKGNCYGIRTLHKREIYNLILFFNIKQGTLVGLSFSS